MNENFNNWHHINTLQNHTQMARSLKIFGLFIVIIIPIIFFGPKKTYPPIQMDEEKYSFTINNVEEYISLKEGSITDLKNNNEAKIVWHDSVGKKTKYALVYLHGFSASHEEGAPIHTEVAQRYGMNLYLSRLEDHGRRDTNTFIHLTPDAYMASVEEAIAIGKTIGDSVIIMSCSTGGTLGLIYAAFHDDIHSHIMYSPNIDIYDPKSDLLLYPWGESLSSLVLGGQHNRIQYDSIAQKFWNPIYHTNGIFVIKNIIDQYMDENIFSKITHPIFMGYYFKNDQEQDKVVSVERMLDCFEQLGTPVDLKKKMAFPDGGHHVLCSHVMSKDLTSVKSTTFQFIDEVLQIDTVAISQ